MQVIATAGHVDHGKSALVRALTGMEPDRWAEERRRGLTIDLGFAWMTLPGGDRVAFVDVPGHERFVPNMLAGVGPAPAVLLVVAADGGWMPQSAEHLAAIDAVGIRHGLLAVTRCDLADPGGPQGWGEQQFLASAHRPGRQRAGDDGAAAPDAERPVHPEPDRGGGVGRGQRRYQPRQRGP
ncbi:MAG TPA: GTP-binding protein, partial [Streptosporangiaceae bacterium]|nr:GTP-binding protein [Streptosporangiaceae bacterium]